jgi:hypothetical protein
VGGNGVYSYGSGGFPSSSYNNGNYWVSPVYEVLPDLSAPILVSSTPVDGASSVAVDTAIAAVFDEPVDAGSVTFVLRDGDGVSVAGAMSYDPALLTVSFVPSVPLVMGSTYTADVAVTDLIGNTTTTPLQVSFTTISAAVVAALWDDTVVPGTVDSGDPGSVELGVKFSSSEDVNVTGVRFYKSAANTGTHVGSLWDASGALLASVTFSGESTAGWQEASFSAPVAISAGTTYVVSYFAPDGRYSVTGGYFSASYSSGPLTAPASVAVGGNGVYSYGSGGFPSSSYNNGNYWVTPVYEVP